jgi:hypothetical protein
MTLRIVPETNASLLMSLGHKTFDQAFRQMNDPIYFNTYLARAKGFAAVWLSSWEKNHRGNAFYQKWGFDRVGEKTFDVGGDVQEDVILSRPL